MADVLPRILLFFDYACPFCYIDRFRFDTLRAEYAVEVVLVPFELRPDIAAGGISAKEHDLTHSDKVDQFMFRIAAEGGYPFHLPDNIPNTHLALTMAEVARDRGPEMHERVDRAIFDAYFGRELDIGSKDVLLAEAERLGLDTTAVAAAWLKNTYDERLNGFHHVAYTVGVDATPAALICNELLLGSRPYGIIKDAVERCLITPHSAEKAVDGEHV